MNEGSGSGNKGLIVAVIAVLVLALGAFLFFFMDREDADSTDETATQQTTEEAPAPPPAEQEPNIVEVAANNPDFSTLVAAVQAAGLVETLAGEGPFTVFAPTNAAFEAALAELGITAEELLASDNLADILTYHVVAGEVLAADVVELDGQSVETVNGQSVAITVDDGGVFVNGIAVSATDIPASNGVIHVIDGVLLPESE